MAVGPAVTTAAGHRRLPNPWSEATNPEHSNRNGDSVTVSADYDEFYEQVCDAAATTLLSEPNHEIDFDRLYGALRQTAEDHGAVDPHAVTAEVMETMRRALGYGHVVAPTQQIINDWLADHLPADVARQLRELRAWRFR